MVAGKLCPSHLLLHLPPTNYNATSSPFHAEDYCDDNDDDYVEIIMVARKLGQSHLLHHLPPTNCNATSSPFLGDDYFGDNCDYLQENVVKDNLVYITYSTSSLRTNLNASPSLFVMSIEMTTMMILLW